MILDRLPIDEVLPALLDALLVHRGAVLVAPPGAGKTTRVPLALLGAPWRRDGRIIMLEPRRLAARAAARHMARALGEDVGGVVGTRMRLSTRISSTTRIEVVTEGVFTRMIQDDPELGGVSAVVFDEFHERSLDSDLGLALALDSQAINEGLRVLVMSATLDDARIAGLLEEVPIIRSEGRAFPVETRYIGRNPELRIEEAVAAATLSALKTEAGSILVFLPGQGEIARVSEHLRDRVPPMVELALLYGQLSPLDQDRAIAPAPAGWRKIVLATSIAETSLTIEGIRIVIDCGLRRASKFDPATGLDILKTRQISRAGADQRRGRAGRTEAGVCFRLWSERESAALQPFEKPEMLSSDLTSLVLNLAAWGIRDPSIMRFLDPPPLPALRRSVALLQALGALDQQGAITAAGRALASLPLHPRLAHMLLCGAAEGDATGAAELAVLLGERGLGGMEIDLGVRLERWRREPGQRADDARKLARRWAAMAGGHSNAPRQLGRHLARAYPDRIAQAAGARGRFRLANGRAAMIEETDPLVRAPYLVVADLTGDAANGRIRSAAPTDRETIEELSGSEISDDIAHTYDAASRTVRARHVRRLGALRLADEPVPVTDAEQAARLLTAAAAAAGIDRLPWTRAQLSLRQRATFLHRHLGMPWPDLSEAALAARAEDWLAPLLVDTISLNAVDPDTLQASLGMLLPYLLRSELDSLLPSHFEAPSGSSLPIDYADERGPALPIRVQELFGLDRHPSVAGGKIPLLLILLSPAHRPIQTTSDLPGFWRGTWKDVAKDLKGRYPRHFWPEDPIAARATSRAKPRGT